MSQVTEQSPRTQARFDVVAFNPLGERVMLINGNLHLESAIHCAMGFNARGSQPSQLTAVVVQAVAVHPLDVAAEAIDDQSDEPEQLEETESPAEPDTWIILSVPRKVSALLNVAYRERWPVARASDGTQPKRAPLCWPGLSAFHCLKA